MIRTAVGVHDGTGQGGPRPVLGSLYLIAVPLDLDSALAALGVGQGLFNDANYERYSEQ